MSEYTFCIFLIEFSQLYHFSASRQIQTVSDFQLTAFNPSIKLPTNTSSFLSDLAREPSGIKVYCASDGGPVERTLRYDSSFLRNVVA
jgi:hypothetical protein